MFVNWSDANYMWEEDSERGPLAGRRVRLREVKADLWGSTTELLAKAMDQGQIDAPLNEEDKVLLVEFLVRAGYLDSEDHLYRPPNLRGSQDRYDLSALLRSGFGTRVRSLYAVTGGPHPVFQPVGGMMEIPLAFQRAIGDHITMNAEVQSVHQTEDAVRVVYRDTRTGQEREEIADYCVCCLPMAVLQGIDVDLSPEMAAAVNETSHSTSAKMGLQMKRRFWEEDDGIFGGHLFGRSLELGEFSYPSNDYFTEKGVLLGFYGGGGTARMADMPFAGRIEHVLTQASKVHPQMREEFETAYCVWWDKVPYSLGAYGRTPAPEELEQLSKADGRIYMGSAGASTRPPPMPALPAASAMASKVSWGVLRSVITNASRPPKSCVRSKAAAKSPTTGRPAHDVASSSASMTQTISTGVPAALSTMISANSPPPARAIRCRPSRAQLAKSAPHWCLASRKKLKETDRYSAVSRLFSANPRGVR